MKKLFTFIVVMFFASFIFAQPFNVTFSVDMTAPIGTGDFVVGTDHVWLTGSMCDWSEPGIGTSIELTDGDADGKYTGTLSVAAAGEISYKFFKNDGWSGGEWNGDPNRTDDIQADVTLLKVWGDQANSIADVKNLFVTVFPNPAVDYFVVNAQNGIASIIDITGKVLISQNLSISNSINVSSLSTGIYFIKVENNEGTTVQKVVIK